MRNRPGVSGDPLGDAPGGGMEPTTIMTGIGALLQGIGGMQANAANERMNSINIAHQNLWRTTAHQVEVEDLKKAGLNPILSAGGTGAQTPGGSSLQQSNPFEGMAAAAKELALLESQKKLVDAQVKKTDNEGDALKGAAAKGNWIEFVLKKLNLDPKNQKPIKNKIKQMNQSNANKQEKSVGNMIKNDIQNAEPIPGINLNKP